MLVPISRSKGQSKKNQEPLITISKMYLAGRLEETRLRLRLNFSRVLSWLKIWHYLRLKTLTSKSKSQKRLLMPIGLKQ